MEGERHNTKRQGEADGERSAEEAMVEGRDGRTKEGRGGRAARTGREQTAPAGHLETFAKNASYMGGLREGWIEKHSNKEEATGGTGTQEAVGCVAVLLLSAFLMHNVAVELRGCNPSSFEFAASHTQRVPAARMVGQV